MCKLLNSNIVTPILELSKFGSFPFLPPQYVLLPPVTEHVSLHSKSLCKNIARASGGCK